MTRRYPFWILTALALVVIAVRFPARQPVPYADVSVAQASSQRPDTERSVKTADYALTLTEHPGLLPPPDLSIELQFSGSGRVARLRAERDAGIAWLRSSGLLSPSS